MYLLWAGMQMLIQDDPSKTLREYKPIFKEWVTSYPSVSVRAGLWFVNTGCWFFFIFSFKTTIVFCTKWEWLNLGGNYWFIALWCWIALFRSTCTQKGFSVLTQHDVAHWGGLRKSTAMLSHPVNHLKYQRKVTCLSQSTCSGWKALQRKWQHSVLSGSCIWKLYDLH